MNQTQALDILKTGANVFLTGEPGSGKTYTINQYVAYLRSHGIEPAITASTGIAATHIGGMTIHSWSGIGIKNKLSQAELGFIATNERIFKRINKTKVLIIDEISMLSPMTLSMISDVCREVRKSDLPFGGLQIILVGDFFQLPPVVKREVNGYSENDFSDEVSARFAFEADIWREADFTICYLTEQHRQDDGEFLQLLNKIRRNNFDDTSLKLISSRKQKSLTVPENTPKLYSHNIDVDMVNDQMLDKIMTKSYFYPMKTVGRESLIMAMKKGCLSPEKLYLKVGAAVMFTKNNPKEGYVNGTLGIVDGFDQEKELPIVRIRSGQKITVSPAEWSVEEDGKIRGSLTQLPLRLAWAITVHKSQGISLDEAVIDLSRVFEFGQGYVALSRVRRLSGIYLLGWNDRAFQVDENVLEKDSEFRADSEYSEKNVARMSKETLRKMQDDFVIFCGGSLEALENTGERKKKISTSEETLKLWQAGKPVKRIAELRSLSESTIVSHLEDLVKMKKINRSEIEKIVPKRLLPHIAEVKRVFQKLDTDKLKPVFEHFEAKFSYDDLRLIRILIAAKW